MVFNRSLRVPEWGRPHFRLLLFMMVALAVTLRLAHHHGADVEAAPSESHLPVAAAIGLSSDIPDGDALSTWINAVLYSVALKALFLSHPELSLVDYGAAFLADPEAFCALARLAALLAGAATIYLTWRVVSTLIDRPTALSAAFILAVHPTAVSFTAEIGSGVFSLLLLACALLIVARIDWDNARPSEFAAIGLCLGFATGALLLAPAVFALIIALAIHRTPHAVWRALAARIALALACFSIAAALVIPAAASAAEFAQGAIIVALIFGAGHLLRSLRESIHQKTYSAAVIYSGLAVGVFAAATFTPTEPALDRDPASRASQWMVQNLPADGVVVVHPRLAESILLPRTAPSLQRDARRAEDSHAPSSLYTLAAIQAASLHPEARYDVIVSEPHQSLSELFDHPEHGDRVQYIVAPDNIDAPGLDASDQLWFVARFRSPVSEHPGVTIWGTQAAPRAAPIHVEWDRGGSSRLALLPQF